MRHSFGKCTFPSTCVAFAKQTSLVLIARHLKSLISQQGERIWMQKVLLVFI